MTMTEEIERLHMLKNYRPSEETLEYAKMLEEVYQKVVMRRACLDAVMPREKVCECGTRKVCTTFVER